MSAKEINIHINGEVKKIQTSQSIEKLLHLLKLNKKNIAIEINRVIINKSDYHSHIIEANDQIEIVNFIGGGNHINTKESLIIAGKEYKSRLIMGSGKFESFEENLKALEIAESEIITVAVRRTNISDPNEPMITDIINPNKYTYLPNTAGCYNAEEAIRVLNLAREAGGWNLVKLEVLGDDKTLYPNMIETIKASKILVKEGFKVMAYCTDDPILAKKLEENGCSAIMPLGSPIGSGLGIQNKLNIKIIIDNCSVPVIVDAGLGTASDACIAMEMGCDGVLVNSAIAKARNPILMAEAMKQAVISGRNAYISGRMEKNIIAKASSPIKDF
ncbi:MAG: Thiazole synthase [Alphaproteobacteria bacterium MarineAlpha9_Bin3]|nr:MAG: Thiazole synthase [Alphaproteobacteria bacterium MarineAlpha9_Bin3]|tara:strand:- start:2066 stop:3058 length:993 start_codon:yes stop_codon:yes gene_type:complete